MTARCRCGSGRRTRSPTPPGRMPTRQVGMRPGACRPGGSADDGQAALAAVTDVYAAAERRSRRTCWRGWLAEPAAAGGSDRGGSDRGGSDGREGGEMRSREWHLLRRPQGWPMPADFALVDRELPPVQAGEVVVRNLYLSVDPYMRGRMNAARSYAT